MALKSEFDAARYWRERHEKYQGLRATGTLGGGVGWQRWLYRGKVRAYTRALSATGISLTGARVLDFGCGNGYFEDVWEARGARHIAGIDIVDEVIEQLRARHPHRSYRAGNLANNAELISDSDHFDLVTAIDVLYHIIDDLELERVISRLALTMAKDGCLLFTDALTDSPTAPHVRFRPFRFWEDLLARQGLSLIHREPVFVVQNRPNLLSRSVPSLAGAIAYWLDVPLTRVLPGLANNFALIARRETPTGRNRVTSDA